MRKKVQQSNKRSEAIEEIMERIPGWMTRWGIVLIGSIFFCVSFMGWVIRYPDVVVASVVIESDPAPTQVVARASGKIKLLKKDNDFVTSSDIIAYLTTDANVLDILKLDSLVVSKDGEIAKIVDDSMELGELQPLYTNLTEAYNNFKNDRTLNLKQEQISHLQKQIASIDALSASYKDQMILCKKRLRLAWQDFSRDSILHRQNVISKKDFQFSASNYIQHAMACKQVEAQKLANNVQVEVLRKQIVEIDLMREEELSRTTLSLENSIRELRAGILCWKEVNLMKSSRSGVLTYLHFLKDDMVVKEGDELFAISKPASTVHAEVQIPIEGSGKVQVGQKVNIKLDNYPFEQFGSLDGVVSKLSDFPSDGKYLATVALKNGLLTTHNKNLVFRHRLSGRIEIITNDYSLLERVYFNLITLIDKTGKTNHLE